MSKITSSAGGGSSPITYVENQVIATFTAAFGAPQNITLKITRVGRLLTVDIPAVSAASGGTAGVVFVQHSNIIPALFRPSEDVEFYIATVSGGGVSSSPGKVLIKTDGTLRIYLSGNQVAEFSQAGNNGWKRTSVSYFIP